MVLAAGLVAWIRLLALHGDAARLRSCEPKALRYRLWRVPARLTRGQRRRRLRVPRSWPWATAIVAVFVNIAAIPNPPDPPLPTTRKTIGDPQPGSASRPVAVPRTRITASPPTRTPVDDHHERPGLRGLDHEDLCGVDHTLTRIARGWSRG